MFTETSIKEIDPVIKDSLNKQHESFDFLQTRQHEILIPADGDCLYTAVFLGYLLPVIEQSEAFKARFSILTGYKDADCQEYQKLLSENFQNINFLIRQDFKAILNVFKNHMEIRDALWGGPEEIIMLAAKLNVVIQELIVNPTLSEKNLPYIKLDSNQAPKADDPAETIYILRTKADPREVKNKSDDHDTQIARLLSAASDEQFQHYRLIFPSKNVHEETFHPATATQQRNKAALENFRLSETLSMASEMLGMFHKIFQKPNTDKTEENLELKQKQVTELVLGHQNPTSLLATATEFIEGSNIGVSAFKNSENNTISELLIRIGMQQRPEYFHSGHEEKSENQGYNIGAKFLNELNQNGIFDYWNSAFEETIKSEADEISRDAMINFMKGGIKYLKYLSSEDVHDPSKDPLNKYSKSEDIARALKLKTWLEENTSSPEYTTFHREFLELDKTLKKNRRRAFFEAGEYMISLVKAMDPRLRDTKTHQELIQQREAEWRAKQRQNFENFILKDFGKLDIFESNALRAFWDRLERNNYGNIFYKIVCESFKPEYKDSQCHQITQTLWALINLDTIQENPKEARSRMPTVSINGDATSNFGYDITKSEAFQKWIRNPLIRGTCDIVIDTFHFVVDLGCKINIDIFIQRLTKHLSLAKDDRMDIVCNPDDYDTFMIPFMLHLLERHYSTPFVSDDLPYDIDTIDFENTKSVSSELLRVSGGLKNLILAAKELLLKFKDFSNNMLALRPNPNLPAKKHGDSGFVFGIGFNGALFNSANKFDNNENEIWIGFSGSVRHAGGYLHLTFMKEALKSQSHELTEFIQITPQTLQSYYEKYLGIIKQHIKELIKHQYFMPDLQQSPRSLEYLKKQRTKYEGFRAQLELDPPLLFESLSSELKNWIRDFSNWYSIPQGIKIKIPEEMPNEEFTAQNHARELLFDVLTGRSFSREHPELMSFIFLNWRDELLNFYPMQSSQERNAILNAHHFTDLPQQLKRQVESQVDQLICQIHPGLRAVWEPEIDYYFQEFMKDKIQSIANTISSKTNTIKKQKKLALKKPENSEKINEFIRKCDLELNDAIAQQSNLPKTPADLPLEQYNTFKTLFFQKRSVSQCIEPVFSRVLNHGQFITFRIAKKFGETYVIDHSKPNAPPLYFGNRIPQDVIAPCNQRCQLHVLGHVAIGDLLSHQSADGLNQKRQIHQLGEVPDRFMTFERLKTLEKEWMNLTEASVLPTIPLNNPELVSQYNSFKESATSHIKTFNAECEEESLNTETLKKN